MKSINVKFKNVWNPHNKGETLILSTIAIFKKYTKNPQKRILTAIKRLRSGVKILTTLVSGKVIPLPAYLAEDGANYRAMRWILSAARERSKHQHLTANSLVEEIKETLKKKGRAFKSKRDLIKEIRDARVNLRKSFRRHKWIKKKKKNEVSSALFQKWSRLYQKNIK
jgi:ribosomal protein S7